MITKMFLADIIWGYVCSIVGIASTITPLGAFLYVARETDILSDSHLTFMLLQWGIIYVSVILGFVLGQNLWKIRPSRSVPYIRSFLRVTHG